mmetsp:Transcript_15191/g.38543  ORF Transcript_15191/g.38543 Transcript_15191/m.38543 type:complete len:255 (-) Transcript_15191:99-863(-)
MPRPPARVLSKKYWYAGSLLKRSMAILRSSRHTPPSMRQALWPLSSKYTSSKSSILVIWEKISTLWPLGSSLFRRRSSRRILPHWSTISWPVGSVSDPSYSPVIRSGWLQFLRICIKMFRSLLTFPLEQLRLASFFIVSTRVLSRSSWLIFFWWSVMVGYRMISFFMGSEMKTSAFNRRSKKGLRMLCSFSTIFVCCSAAARSCPSPTFEKSNHLSKSERLAKTSGSKKLSKLQSSERLFWSGVPVKRSLLSAL